jgi:proline utilization trans-activator
LTYSRPHEQAYDRNWLCRISVVLALAEAWNRGRTSALKRDDGASQQIDSSDRSGLLDDGNPQSTSSPAASSPMSDASVPPPPPGSDFFEQGLLLLKMSLEEPVIADVEALNLIVSLLVSSNHC